MKPVLPGKDLAKSQRRFLGGKRKALLSAEEDLRKESLYVKSLAYLLGGLRRKDLSFCVVEDVLCTLWNFKKNVPAIRGKSSRPARKKRHTIRLAD